MILAALLLLAAEPAPSNVPGAAFPRIESDRSVTFRVRSPNAKQVAVAGRAADSGMHGNKPFDMTRDAEGFWTVTIPPVRPGFHYYELIVDGHRTTDPASETYFGWAQQTSGLEVPDPSLDFCSVRDVPHGQVRALTYHSRVTNESRTAMVYTPPEYDTTRTRYPVLYLQHGSGENHTSWTKQGKANLILDNLIAAKKAVPMIVVMDRGYGVGTNNELFERVVIEDLIPTIDRTFRTQPKRESRALAGLSMGGGQALRIGTNHPETFSEVAALSGAVRDFDAKKALTSRFRTLWIGCGTEDRLLPVAEKLHESLAAAGVKHVWFTGPGGHEWQVWRKHLREITPILFRHP